MTTYKLWDIVILPFPFSDSEKAKPRPGLIVTSKTYNQQTGHSMVMMITSAKQTRWKTDILLPKIKTTGLPAESYIRAKVATITNKVIKKKIGALPQKFHTKVKKQLLETFF